MKLSVVIPVYNTAATLERCVMSVVAQAVDDIEVIIVDDGSTDSSPRKCDEWAEKVPYLRALHQPNQGLSAARNAALAVCKGEFVTFVDSDDALAPDTYGPLLSILGQHPDYDLLEFPLYKRYGDKGGQQKIVFGSCCYNDWRDYWLGGKAYAHAYACNKIYRRKLFGRVQFPVGKTFEDTATLPLLAQKCRKIATTDRGCYLYYPNPCGITATATGADLANLLAVHNHWLPIVSDGDYYAHALNIALDVYHATGAVPALVNLPYSHTIKLKLKHYFGLKALCLLHRIFHRRHL